MKFASVYLKFIGISSFLILLGGAIYFAFFMITIDFVDLIQLMVTIVISVVFFFGLHYIALTSFGFIDSNGAIAFIPPIIQRIPIAVLFILMTICGGKYFYHYQLYIETLPLTYSERFDIMNSEELNLLGKLEKLRMNITQDSIVNQMTISLRENLFVNRVDVGVDLSKYYAQFSLSENLRSELSKLYIDFDGGQTFLSLSNGRRITVNASNDSILGYLQSRDVFIKRSQDLLFGAKFESISRANGDNLSGIPLIANNSNKLFADLHYRYQSNGVDFQITVWQRNMNRVYTLRQSQTIPLGMYHNASLTSFVKNITWRSDTLLFDLVALDQNKLKQISFSIY